MGGSDASVPWFTTSPVMTTRSGCSALVSAITCSRCVSTVIDVLADVDVRQVHHAHLPERRRVVGAQPDRARRARRRVAGRVQVEVVAARRRFGASPARAPSSPRPPACAPAGAKRHHMAAFDRLPGEAALGIRVGRATGATQRRAHRRPARRAPATRRRTTVPPARSPAARSAAATGPRHAAGRDRRRQGRRRGSARRPAPARDPGDARRAGRRRSRPTASTEREKPTHPARV